jgi:hypothetical protein
MSRTGTLAFTLGEYRDNETTGEFVQGRRPETGIHRSNGKNKKEKR